MTRQGLADDVLVESPVYMAQKIGLGGSIFSNHIVMKSLGDFGQCGLDLLRSFDQVSIDYQRNRIYFYPKKVNNIYSCCYSGLTFKTEIPHLNIYTVQLVDQFSPASSCGVQVGDRIDAVDGEATSTMSFFQVYTALINEGAHSLKLIRDGKALELNLLTYDLCKDPYRVMNMKLKSGYFRIKDIFVYGQLKSVKPEEVIRATFLSPGDLVRKQDLNVTLKELISLDVLCSGSIYFKGNPDSIDLALDMRESSVVSGVSIVGLPDENDGSKLLEKLSTERGKYYNNMNAFRDFSVIRGEFSNSLYNYSINAKTDSNNHVFFEIK